MRVNQTSLSWRHDYPPGAWIFVDAMICKRASQVLLRTNRLALFKAWEPKANTAEKQLKLEVKPNLSYSDIPVCQICRTALSLGSSNLMWWQPSQCPTDLARSNWKAAFISLRELQILWLRWSEIPSGLSRRLCCNKRAFRICVGGGFSCVKGDPSLVAVTLHSHITLQFITSNMSSSTM